MRRTRKLLVWMGLWAVAAALACSLAVVIVPRVAYRQLNRRLAEEGRQGYSDGTWQVKVLASWPRTRSLVARMLASHDLATLACAVDITKRRRDSALVPDLFVAFERLWRRACEQGTWGSIEEVECVGIVDAIVAIDPELEKPSSIGDASLWLVLRAFAAATVPEKVANSSDTVLVFLKRRHDYPRGTWALVLGAAARHDAVDARTLRQLAMTNPTRFPSGEFREQVLDFINKTAASW